MPIIERGALGPGFDRRLKVALDAVVPSAPLFARYFLITPVRSSRPWRFASALVGVGAVGVMALSAFAETGSANPMVWTQRAASTIQSVSHIPETSPTPPPSATPDAHLAAPVSQQTGTSKAPSSPGHKTEPSNTARPTEKRQDSPPSDRSHEPEASPPLGPGEHPSPSPEPSDSPGHEPGQGPTSSPPPDDHGGGQHWH